jgi:hypothetical protein
MEGIRIVKRLGDNQRQEYDTVAVCAEYLLITETKTTLRPEYVRDFVEKLRRARDFFPEYPDKQIIGAMATFYVDPSLITHGERQGLIMMGIVEGLLQILNSPGFDPSRF